MDPLWTITGCVLVVASAAGLVLYLRRRTFRADPFTVLMLCGIGLGLLITVLGGIR